MEKEEIVSNFLEKGLIIDSESLNYFLENPDQINVFFEKIKDIEKPPIIKNDFVKKILEIKKSEIKEIKKQTLSKKTFSIDDVSRILFERYEKIRSFFSYRMEIVNLISINKINDKTKKFSLIVMVREIDDKNKTALVEDFTGETTVFFPNNLFNFIVQDEVLGLVCEKNEDRIEVLNVLWPDLPLKRKISVLEEDVYCMFLSSKIFYEKKEQILKEISKLPFKYLYVFLFFNPKYKKEVEDFNKKLPKNTSLILINKNEIEIDGVQKFSTPSFLTIDDKIKLLLVDGSLFSIYEKVLGEKTEEIMLNLLKKRHLNPKFTIEKAFMEDYFIVDPIPDIFVSFDFGSSGMINYKGTTIISCGVLEQICWVLNLRTRESLKISLT
ncbi:MAG: hypothetical protein QXX38_02980 [Candidatus Aenigmatarchaeota archaeon]